MEWHAYYRHRSSGRIPSRQQVRQTFKEPDSYQSFVVKSSTTEPHHLTTSPSSNPPIEATVTFARLIEEKSDGTYGPNTSSNHALESAWMIDDDDPASDHHAEGSSWYAANGHMTQILGASADGVIRKNDCGVVGDCFGAVKVEFEDVGNERWGGCGEAARSLGAETRYSGPHPSPYPTTTSSPPGNIALGILFLQYWVLGDVDF